MPFFFWKKDSSPCSFLIIIELQFIDFLGFLKVYFPVISVTEVY